MPKKTDETVQNNENMLQSHREESENGVKADEKAKDSITGRDVYDILQIFFQSLIIITLLFIFVFRFSVVNGDSMLPTLKDGNWLILSNIGFQPERGDIVVVSQPNTLDEVLIKRIIALPGETVDLREDGIVTVDGKPLNEPYTAAPVIEQGEIAFPHKVPEGKVFVMGDNRNHSADSRYKGIGDIDVRYIVGEAKFRLFPLDHGAIYENVDYQMNGDIGETDE